MIGTRRNKEGKSVNGFTPFRKRMAREASQVPARRLSEGEGQRLRASIWTLSLQGVRVKGYGEMLWA